MYLPNSYPASTKAVPIDDIDWERNPTTKLKSRNGDKMTFVNCYKKQHGISIYDIEQPLIVVNLFNQQLATVDCDIHSHASCAIL